MNINWDQVCTGVITGVSTAVLISIVPWIVQWRWRVGDCRERTVNALSDAAKPLLHHLCGILAAHTMDPDNPIPPIAEHIVEMEREARGFAARLPDKVAGIFIAKTNSCTQMQEYANDPAEARRRFLDLHTYVSSLLRV